MRKLRYYPELNEVTGGVASTIVMLQLEYWFECRGGKAFFKFLEPCMDEHYKAGDSWTEELGFTRAEFRTSFSKIGKVYKSKREYLESQDKFGGKLYLSYYDRIKRLTYYIRNHESVEACFKELEEVPIADVWEEGEVLIESETYEVSRNTVDEVPLSLKQQHTLPISQRDATPYEQIINLFNQRCMYLVPIKSIGKSLKKRIDRIWQKIKGDMGILQELFEKVQRSDFLSGRIVGKHFKATLEWILKEDKFKAIMEDKYAHNYTDGVSYEREDTLGDRPTSKKVKNKKVSRFNKMATHDWDFDQLERLEADYIEQTVALYQSGQGL